MDRKEVLLHIKNKYGVEPDYPWMRSPNYAILRHIDSLKWFGAIVDITEDKLGIKSNKIVDALLLKCDRIIKGSIIDNNTIFPAYHMNKEHWITVHLANSTEQDKVFNLIDLSFNLTKKRD